MRRGIRDKTQTCSTMGHSINKCSKVSNCSLHKKISFRTKQSSQPHIIYHQSAEKRQVDFSFHNFFFINFFFIFSSNFSFHQICTRCFKKRMPYPVAWRSNYIHITFIKKINKLHTYYNHLKLIRTLLNSSFRL